MHVCRSTKVSTCLLSDRNMDWKMESNFSKYMLQSLRIRRQYEGFWSHFLSTAGRCSEQNWIWRLLRLQGIFTGEEPVCFLLHNLKPSNFGICVEVHPQKIGETLQFICNFHELRDILECERVQKPWDKISLLFTVRVVLWQKLGNPPPKRSLEKQTNVFYFVRR